MNDTGQGTGTVRTDAAAAGKLMWSLIEAARSQEERLEGVLGAIGLSAPRLGVLTELVLASSPLALSEIAARLSCVRSNVTQLVDRLEADGLVKRVADPADRRSVRAEITPEGRARQADGARLQAQVQEEFASRLSAEDLRSLQRALAALK